ncbi:hypothetical protein ACP4OV_007081 [Aristida adscensionis]
MVWHGSTTTMVRCDVARWHGHNGLGAARHPALNPSSLLPYKASALPPRGSTCTSPPMAPPSPPPALAMATGTTKARDAGGAWLAALLALVSTHSMQLYRSFLHPECILQTWPRGGCAVLILDHVIFCRILPHPTMARPQERCAGTPFDAPELEITIDAPELEMLNVYCTPWSTRDYRLFTLRAPRLRWLYWQNQFAERVCIDVGKPGSVEGGVDRARVDLHTRAQVLPRADDADAPRAPSRRAAGVHRRRHKVRPYRTLGKYEDGEDSDEEEATEEKITCEL